ncbi:ester cyclase [Terriglobus sp. TAA 43]|uniref:ester cyclase n=1 Tax=Terriglobus sp. TAA 43 TaxID=278961 RepID=UPI0006468B23|nr:ester cyclase [Terriglobus sp. TAA 43]
MAQDLHKFTHRWFDDVWNDYKEASLDEMLSRDVVCYDFPNVGETVGFARFKETVEHFHANFSNIRVVVDDVIVEGNRVASRWHVNMTHTGDGMGFSATGRTIAFNGISWVEIQDGKIVKGWNGFDLTHPISTLKALSTAIAQKP